MMVGRGVLVSENFPLQPPLSAVQLSRAADLHSLAADDVARIKALLQRRPTLTELAIFGALWSEHCSYKSTRALLRKLPRAGTNVVVGPGENAGAVLFEDDLCLVFKMESHNHPTYIDPFNGAATGVGGIMRDVFCMGARPIANFNALRFAPDQRPQLLPTAVRGISAYGNCVGVPTAGGNVALDPRYTGNCLVNVMTLGICRQQELHFARAGESGNLVVYLGAKTGRDGIGGASMASQNFADGEQERGCVQVGDPFLEKLLLEATLELLQQKLLVGLQDMGAAGLTSSAFEIATRADKGMQLNLDHVPLRTADMRSDEIMLSEAQERMLLIVPQHNYAQTEAICHKWLLDVAVMGKITASPCMEIFFQQQTVARIPLAKEQIEAPLPQHRQTPRRLHLATDAAAQLHARIQERGIAAVWQALHNEQPDQQEIYEQFDRSIGQRTLRTSEDGGATVLWLRDWGLQNPHRGVAVATAALEDLCYLDPRHGAEQTVMKTARMLYAFGAEPLGLTDCLNFGDPRQPEVMWELAASIAGIAAAAQQLAVPVVSGNVSLYNANNGHSIPPTPMIGLVGKINNVSALPSAVCKSACLLYLLQPDAPHAPLPSAALRRVLGLTALRVAVPAVDWAQERAVAVLLKQLLAHELLVAVRDVSSRGWLPTLAAMLTAQDLAADLTAAPAADLLWYFGLLPCAYLLAVPHDKAAALLHAVSLPPGMRLTALGKVQRGREYRLRGNGWRVER